MGVLDRLKGEDHVAEDHPQEEEEAPMAHSMAMDPEAEIEEAAHQREGSGTGSTWLHPLETLPPDK